MLEAKLERYVKNCYPPGSGSEKHAKPSELSYLMYYLQSHRHRISHAARLLQNKLYKQVSRQTKLGNAVVTLEIARELVVSCTDDLNVFAPTILEMAARALPHQEVAISVAASKMFEELVRVYDGLLFTDKHHATLFLEVMRTVSQMGTKHGSDSQAQREAALETIAVYTQSPCITTERGLQALDYAVQALYADSKLGQAPADKALKTLFGSSQPVIDQTTRSILRSALGDKHPDHHWALKLMENAAQWAQVQLRFRIPKIVLSQMINQPKALGTLCDYLLVLLRSPVSMIGLDVRLTLSQLLDLQHQNPHDSKLRHCISALAAHTVYPGQANDMLKELLARYTALPDQTPQVSDEIIVCDLENVQAILSAVHVEHLLLSPWIATQWLLTRSDAVLVAYTNAFAYYVTDSDTENPKQASQLARQLSQILLQSQTAPTYIAAYYCLERLVGALGSRSVVLAPTVGQLQDAGIKISSNPGKLEKWQVAASISSSQALLLGIARASGRKTAEVKYFQGISHCVETGAWLRGIICPSNGVPIDEAVAAAAKHPPQVDSLRTGQVLDLADLELTPAEQAQAVALDAPIDESVPLGSLENFRTRARSLADSVTTSGDQRILSGRVPTGATIDAPTVSQLRRRVTSTQSFNSAGSSTFLPSTKLTSMLGSLNIDSGTKGRLVV